MPKQSREYLEKWNYIDGIHTYPDKYELVSILHSDGKIQPGWWSSYGWDGYNPIRQDTVIAWRLLLMDRVAPRRTKEELNKR